MSLSISSSEPRAVPSGEVDGLTIDYRVGELRWAKRLCAASPLVALIAIPVVHRYLLYLIYLQPPPSTWGLVQAFQSPKAIAVGLALAALPVAWLIGVKTERIVAKSRIPWAVVLAVVALMTMGTALTSPRGRWFFVEWAKVRTANPSFARNTLLWEQRNFEHTPAARAHSKVGLVGSSQMNQGCNLTYLHDDCPEIYFEKNCLAGFGPIQYPFLDPRLRQRGFQTIVCQLSEFDFYREDVLPTERLRWAASMEGTMGLGQTLTPGELWSNRAAMGDLALASVVPIWRLREHFRRTIFGYWWDKSSPHGRGTGQERAASDQAMRLANAPLLEQAIVFLKQNIGQKELVNANFSSFQRYARLQQERNVRLIVMEGQVHPRARRAYDHQGLQQATRERLERMAAAYGFEYFPSSEMPTFTDVDFADAYHLNRQGQMKMSSFLAEKVLSTEY